ncbi:AraC family transcriptional regulator [Pseudomonas endophytica]|uniref:AraC family transcriptional regulator n=1 Tax=Pseudomonas endophytica TaxID=1563157 RepID=A0A0N8VSC6_9PSED|nr:GlxA family transcriptional regulator [Pseudomonas endophytica]KQB52948.1 AraC family transcriptional regulator [Pseudomonas endophytica]
MQDSGTGKTIAMLIFDGVLMLDITGPMDAFAVANRFLPMEKRYRLLTLGVDDGLIRSSCGLQVKADISLAQAPSGLDLLLVPGGPGAYDDTHPVIQEWLPEATRSAKRFGAICTGTFLLGKAGLLDGYRCTTHWNYLGRLAQQHPGAKVESEQIYVVDRNLITSGGITAGIDMALAIIAEDYGKELALEVAKVLLVVMKRQGGQMQFGPLLVSVTRDGSPVARAQAYVVDHIEKMYSVQSMADMVAMSSRNFARSFQREAGLTPMQFVQSARIDHARRLLEGTNLPLKTIATRCGFCSAKYMRKVFCERIGVSPNLYRQQFGVE